LSEFEGAVAAGIQDKYPLAVIAPPRPELNIGVPEQIKSAIETATVAKQPAWEALEVIEAEA
jgi:hypothetical protein